VRGLEIFLHVLGTVRDQTLDEPVTSHANPSVNGGHFDIQAFTSERLPPRHGMEVAGIDQGSIHIEKNAAFLSCRFISCHS
jgi:hypothetical protein